MTASKENFDTHMKQCIEALEIFDYLKANGYEANFGLRFVWVASVSALDHYITELIIEKSTYNFANNIPLSNKLQNEYVPMMSLLTMHKAPPPLAVVEFRKIVANAVRFRTFQKADDVADGLSFIWNEEHKWNKISEKLGIDNKRAKRKLNSIVVRRDGIVHNADYDESSQTLNECDKIQAAESSNYIRSVVNAIEELLN